MTALVRGDGCVVLQDFEFTQAVHAIFKQLQAMHAISKQLHEVHLAEQSGNSYRQK